MLLLLAGCDGKPVHLPLARRPGIGAGQQRRLSADEARLYGDTSELMAYHADIEAPWQQGSVLHKKVHRKGSKPHPISGRRH